MQVFYRCDGIALHYKETVASLRSNLGLLTLLDFQPAKDFTLIHVGIFPRMHGRRPVSTQGIKYFVTIGKIKGNLAVNPGQVMGT